MFAATQEMFTFDDLNDSVVLRPEGTAGRLSYHNITQHNIAYARPFNAPQTMNIIMMALIGVSNWL
jgi:histidyl-tRNA synthetase